MCNSEIALAKKFVEYFNSFSLSLRSNTSFYARFIVLDYTAFTYDKHCALHKSFILFLNAFSFVHGRIASNELLTVSHILSVYLALLPSNETLVHPGFYD